MSPPEETDADRGDWLSAWPDLLAFLIGLGVAWFAGWNTPDLVWSLWLASLVVGYSSLVWAIAGPFRQIVVAASRERVDAPIAGGLAITLSGTGFMLAFFTVHFGGFHFVHSIFLHEFLPLHENAGERTGMPDLALYREVATRYWWFLPAAFLAERGAFRTSLSAPVDTAVTAEAIVRRKAATNADPMMAPYRNVIRMHLLIFFFAFANFAKLENFLVYAVVYAVYFFPWRLVGRREA